LDFFCLHLSQLSIYICIDLIYQSMYLFNLYIFKFIYISLFVNYKYSRHRHRHKTTNLLYRQRRYNSTLWDDFWSISLSFSTFRINNVILFLFPFQLLIMWYYFIFTSIAIPIIPRKLYNNIYIYMFYFCLIN